MQRRDDRRLPRWFHAYKEVSVDIPTDFRLANLALGTMAAGFDSLQWGLALILLAGCVVAWYAGRRRHGLPLPPGPKGFPVIGNIFDAPKTEPFTTYMEWARRFSELTFASRDGQLTEVFPQTPTSSRSVSSHRQSSLSTPQISRMRCWTSGLTYIRTDLRPLWISCELFGFRAWYGRLKGMIDAV